MRCPNCNKFVSYDDPPTVDISDTRIEDDTVTVELRVVLMCAECSGEELKETNSEVEISIDHDCGKPPAEGETEQFEIEDEFEGEGTSRLQTTDRRGKPIQSPRYMRTYYGADVHGSVKCVRCGEVMKRSGSFEEQASFFDELV